MLKKPHLLFSVPGYHPAILSSADLDELHGLMLRCADYNLLVHGIPPDVSESASLLSDCPPGKTAADKLLVGFYTRKQHLVGVLDAIQDYPSPSDWWLGLLLLDPLYRNRGLGKRIYRSFEKWVGERGGRRIFLGVLEANPEALDFWRSIGFEIVERQSGRRFGIRTHVVITMLRNLARSSND